jgi:phage shock protein PspC (stress-responsive transcriptional regulator)
VYNQGTNDIINSPFLDAFSCRLLLHVCSGLYIVWEIDSRLVRVHTHLRQHCTLCIPLTVYITKTCKSRREKRDSYEA